LPSDCVLGSWEQAHPINVLWSPHDSQHFIVASASDVHLHSVASPPASRWSGSYHDVDRVAVECATGRVRRRATRIVNRVVPPAVLVAEEFSTEEKGAAQQVFCFDWCLDTAPASRFHVAIGTSSGSAYLTEYVCRQSSKLVIPAAQPRRLPLCCRDCSVSASPSDCFIKEFAPQHSRTCNSVAWNPVHKNLVCPSALVGAWASAGLLGCGFSHNIRSLVSCRCRGIAMAAGSWVGPRAKRLLRRCVGRQPKGYV
jgi:hypothetical protein